MERDIKMCKILGYGEDAFTLWALKQCTCDILKSFQDKTSPSDCLIFYRPSFGRSGGEKSAEFGEFDAILTSLENIYLIESKWDNLSSFQDDEIVIMREQEMRHRIFSWYIMHWDKKYFNDWESFVKEQISDFQENFRNRRIAPASSILATNLQFILTTLRKQCRNLLSEDNIKNVLVFFYNKNKSTPPTKVSWKGFKLLCMDYSPEVTGNYISI